MTNTKRHHIAKMFLFTLIFAGVNAQADEPLRIQLEGGQVLQVEDKPRIIERAIGLGAQFIADLQETISFTHQTNSGFGLKLSNSRKLYPLGNGDVIVTDTTSVDATYAKDALKRQLDGLGLSLSIRGNAKPSVKRFFISSVSTGRNHGDYSETKGPEGTDVSIGVDHQLYELAAGIRVDKTRYARYNNWLSRFTKNLTGFPLNTTKADEMLLNEGYSFTFEGALGLGPSAIFTTELLTNVPVSIRANFHKTIRSGRFELIIYKHSPKKILFSLRQVRQVLNPDDFRLSYGGSINANLSLLIGGSPLPLVSLPTSFQVFSINRHKSLTTEERFNAVYEIDLNNQPSRELYNKAMSTFDFSLFDVFTLDDLSTTSNIIAKFRDANLKLVLETKEKARIHSNGFNTNTLRIHSTSRVHTRETAQGTATFSGGTVSTFAGRASSTQTQSNLILGEEVSSFEIIAYEEFGKEATLKHNDIVLLATKVLKDDITRKQELKKYAFAFNAFAPDRNRFEIDMEDFDVLGVSHGRMDFFITRKNVNDFAKIDEAKARDYFIRHFKNKLVSKRKRDELKATPIKDWPERLPGVNPKAKSALISFAKGFVDLQQAIINGSKARTASAVRTSKINAANALSKMIRDGKFSELYARIFRTLVQLTGAKPLINLNFYNSRTNTDYNPEKRFNSEAFIRDGLVLSQKMLTVLAGRAYYDNLSQTYSHTPNLNRKGLINFNFEEPFSGYIKILLKTNPDGGNSFSSSFEFVIEIPEGQPKERFVFDLFTGTSPAEQEARKILVAQNQENTVKVLFSLSYDDRTYDVERLIKTYEPKQIKTK